MREIERERGVRTVIASHGATTGQMYRKWRGDYEPDTLTREREREREREKGVSCNRMRFIRWTYSFLVHQKNVSLLNQLRAPGYLNGFWLLLYQGRFIPNFIHFGQ